MIGRLRLFYPFLFIIVPVLTVLTRNPGGSTLWDIATLIAVMLVACALVYGLVALLTRQGWTSPVVPLIVFAGILWFYSYEGLDLLLEAAKRIVDDRPEIRFVLVGGGPEEQRLRALCASRNVSPHVTFTGWLPHERIPEAYREIDIFVYPRRRNRLTELVTPLKPLEAMAMAKVVLASDVGGHQELIEDGRTGFLFKADDVSELVVHLRGLLDASHTWPVIGAAARQFVERERTWQAVAATYAQVYDRACSRSRQAGLRHRP